MISEQTQSVAQRAKSLYDLQLRKILEDEHRDKYVAIEPESGQHFLGITFGEAVQASRQAHPNRIAFVIRIGHTAAIHIGGMTN